MYKVYLNVELYIIAAWPVSTSPHQTGDTAIYMVMIASYLIFIAIFALLINPICSNIHIFHVDRREPISHGTS